MKTITIIITAVLALSLNLLQASNPNPIRPVSNSKSITQLAPVVPMEASFSDSLIEMDYSFLAPSTPAEADFEDAVHHFDYSQLTFEVSAEADFE